MEKKRPARLFIILLLGSLMTVSPFSIDMYLPAFSQIAKDFGTTPARISFSITSYFIGLAVGQLLYGPLLDRFGRKRPLYFGLILYILACLGCMLSHSVEMLAGIRFIQALGGCAALVAATAMVRDFFPVEESAKIFSLLILILGLSPLLAPTLGGFITAWLGWQWVFIILSIIVFLILMALVFFLPEVHKPDTSISLAARPMLAIFFSILKNPQFYTYTLAGAFSFSAMFVYVAGSPVIYLDLFRISPQSYGGIFALIAVGFLGSNQLNVALLRRYSPAQLFYFGLLCQVIIGAVFLLGALNNWYGIVATTVLFFFFLSCLGLTYPNASALALAPFTKNFGSASALLGFLQIGISGLISSGVGLLNPRGIAPVTAMLAGISVIAFLILLAGRKKLAADLSVSGAGADSGGISGREGPSIGGIH